MTAVTAPVNKIIPFSSVDGPGNRTAIFLQGCNIDCRYCHNPETRVTVVMSGHNPDISEAVITVGDGPCQVDITRMTPQAVMEQVKKQVPFIRGITVSGGECMLHQDFLHDLFVLAKGEGLTTLIDSNGTLPFSKCPELLSVTDGVMLDVKAFFQADYETVTGSKNTYEVVLENAVFLAAQGKLEEIRCVICPSLYDGKKSVRALGEYMKSYYEPGAFHFKLISYRPMGVRPEYAHMLTPGTDYMNELAAILSEIGYQDTVVV